MDGRWQPLRQAVDPSWLTPAAPRSAGASVRLANHLAEREKAMIENALREAQGLLSGPIGAAAKLGVPRKRSNQRSGSLESIGVNSSLRNCVGRQFAVTDINASADCARAVSFHRSGFARALGEGMELGPATLL